MGRDGGIADQQPWVSMGRRIGLIYVAATAASASFSMADGTGTGTGTGIGTGIAREIWFSKMQSE